MRKPSSMIAAAMAASFLLVQPAAAAVPILSINLFRGDSNGNCEDTVSGTGCSPIVAVDPHAGPSNLPSIHADNLAGAITATRHLVELGHRRIGFLAGRPDLESARQREQGYRDALAEAGIPVDPELIRVGDYELEMSEVPARQLLTLADRPTAVFAANDLSAIQTMHVARSL